VAISIINHEFFTIIKYLLRKSTL